MAESSMPMISTSVRYIADLIKMIAGNKKRTVFSDPTIMQEVFKEIKEGNNEYQQILAQKTFEKNHPAKDEK
jgi:ABC-type Zn uptake system ZnuABC Zn-binding protein ZnuA